jgi:hypothetical protein
MSYHEYPEENTLRWYDHVLIIDPGKRSHTILDWKTNTGRPKKV